MEIEDVAVDHKLEEKLEEDRRNRDQVLIFDKAHQEKFRQMLQQQTKK